MTQYFVRLADHDEAYLSSIFIPSNINLTFGQFQYGYGMRVIGQGSSAYFTFTPPGIIAGDWVVRFKMAFDTGTRKFSGFRISAGANIGRIFTRNSDIDNFDIGVTGNSYSGLVSSVGAHEIVWFETKCEQEITARIWRDGEQPPALSQVSRTSIADTSGQIIFDRGTWYAETWAIPVIYEVRVGTDGDPAPNEAPSKSRNRPLFLIP